MDVHRGSRRRRIHGGSLAAGRRILDQVSQIQGAAKALREDADTRVREVAALTAGLIMTRGEEMQGVTVSAYNKWDFRMEGLAIGLLNITHELKGVQLGVLNIAYDNPGWRRILPLVNWGNN